MVEIIVSSVWSKAVSWHALKFTITEKFNEKSEEQSNYSYKKYNKVQQATVQDETQGHASRQPLCSLVKSSSSLEGWLFLQTGITVLWTLVIIFIFVIYII